MQRQSMEKRAKEERVSRQKIKVRKGKKIRKMLGFFNALRYQRVENSRLARARAASAQPSGRMRNEKLHAVSEAHVMSKSKW